MLFKANVQPLCRACGKGIKKYTQHFWVRPQKPLAMDRWIVVGVFTSKSEVEAIVKEQVVSVKYHTPPDGERCVWSFTTWDGDSYEDQWFCTDSCAAAFGRLAVKVTDLETQAFYDATQKRHRKLAERALASDSLTHTPRTTGSSRASACAPASILKGEA